MDPQATLTTFMGLVPRELEKTIYNALVEEHPLPIHKNIHGMDLAPTNIALSLAEAQLVNADMREFRLKEALEPIKNDYDFIIIDCPPSLGILSNISLVASDYILVPIETHFKALEGSNELLKTVARVKSKINRDLKVAGFVPTKYDSRNSHDTRALGTIQEILSQVGKVFPPVVRSTAFTDASEQRIPLAMHAPKHPAVAVFEELALSIESLE
ncbi:ParA family protein [Tolypothrix sp. VBCCA 56010]|uniref:ParA family protein n=1 Tax=Tolypothrix sp. VBCCA 56010 TaxID=3137731 RepID=UPI003D7D8913